jgi:hypothetical protein
VRPWHERSGLHTGREDRCKREDKRMLVSFENPQQLGDHNRFR